MPPLIVAYMLADLRGIVENFSASQLIWAVSDSIEAFFISRSNKVLLTTVFVWSMSGMKFLGCKAASRVTLLKRF